MRPFFKKHLALSLCSALFCAALFLPRLDAAADPFYVRVLVAENRKELTVSVKGRYTVRVLPSRKVARQAQKMSSERIVATPRGFKLGAQEWAAEGLLIEPAADRDLYLGQTRFRGNISVFKSPEGLYAVNRLDIERYLYGVLHNEVAPWWPMEALKAQAIAARTYAVYQVQQSKRAAYDLKSSTASQVYGGSTTERYRTCKAVDRTAGQVLIYEGKIFPTYFHATCGGVTAAASELWNIDLPPIGGGAHCGFCRISPHYYWQAKVPLSVIEEALRRNNRPVGQVLRLEPVTRTPSGRLGSLKITGTQSEAVIAAKDFRVWVGGDLMRSTDFAVTVKDDLAEFKGKGWGHGVGLCQWGTLGKALLGTSFQDILNFYYPGSTLSKI